MERSTSLGYAGFCRRRVSAPRDASRVPGPCRVGTTEPPPAARAGSAQRQHDGRQNVRNLAPDSRAGAKNPTARSPDHPGPPCHLGAEVLVSGSATMRFVPPTRAYAGYIFDCDGTLVDSMPLHFRAWRAAFRQHDAGFDFDWPLFVSRAGMPLEQTVEALNVQFGSTLNPAQVVAAQLATYRNLLAQVTAIE